MRCETSLMRQRPDKYRSINN